MENLNKFLNSQKFLVIASSEDNNPWISTVYFAYNKGKFFFISGTDTQHSEQILKNPKVAFATVWHDNIDLKNRQAIQGIGLAKKIDDSENLETAIKTYEKKFPPKDRLDRSELLDPTKSKHMWVIEAEKIKFWNDELYGDKEGFPVEILEF